MWVTLIGFLVMIKPIREAIPVFMLQFNGLDRPEVSYDGRATYLWAVPKLSRAIFESVTSLYCGWVIPNSTS